MLTDGWTDGLSIHSVLTDGHLLGILVPNKWMDGRWTTDNGPSQKLTRWAKNLRLLGDQFQIWYICANNNSYYFAQFKTYFILDSLQNKEFRQLERPQLLKTATTVHVYLIYLILKYTKRTSSPLINLSVNLSTYRLIC